jgi:hypothetical protein
MVCGVLRPTSLVSPGHGIPPTRLPDLYASVYDPLETLSYVAATTHRIRLGTSVLDALFHAHGRAGPPHRHARPVQWGPARHRPRYEPDAPDSWDAHYEPYAVDGERAVAVGWSRYAPEGDDPEKTYHNAYLLRFAPDALTARINDLEREIAALTARLAPTLLALIGCGALTAAKLVGETAGVGRFRHRAAFARHNGTAPVPVWSGNQVRHRLSRGGNRQLNAAIHRIAITQLQCPGPGRDYLEGRRAAGDTKTEAIRAPATPDQRRGVAPDARRRTGSDEPTRRPGGRGLT